MPHSYAMASYNRIITTDLRKPTETHDAHWIWQDPPPSIRDKGETLGKWLVFKHKSRIDETWEKIRKVVESGELGATGAKTSTMKYNPNATSPDTKVICVYTTAEDMDEVGLKLIHIVCQTIRYKTDEATISGKYTCHGSGKVTCRTLEWNKGNPTFKD